MGLRFRVRPELTGWVRFHLEMEIPSDLANVGPVAGYLSKIARGHGFPMQVWAENLPLAVDEAISNAIRHGHAKDPRKLVKVEARYEGRELMLRVEDEGPGFDPDSLPDPREGDGPFRSSGRGVFLIRRLCDEAEYLEGGRVLRMVFRR